MSLLSTALSIPITSIIYDSGHNLLIRQVDVAYAPEKLLREQAIDGGMVHSKDVYFVRYTINSSAAFAHEGNMAARINKNCKTYIEQHSPHCVAH